MLQFDSTLKTDAFDSNSIACSLTLHGYGPSRFNMKYLLIDNNHFIMLGAPGGCNSCNYFPWAIAFIIHPKLVSIYHFGYFIIQILKLKSKKNLKKYNPSYYHAMAKNLDYKVPYLNGGGYLNLHCSQIYPCESYAH